MVTLSLLYCLAIPKTSEAVFYKYLEITRYSVFIVLDAKYVYIYCSRYKINIQYRYSSRTIMDECSLVQIPIVSETVLHCQQLQDQLSHELFGKMLVKLFSLTV